MVEKNKNINVGENINADNANWTFSGNVVKSFSEHVKKSVPLYTEGHNLVCQISDYFLHDGSYCYELGVSTGELIKKLAERHRNKNINFVGIDIEPDMINEAKSNLSGFSNVDIEIADILLYEYKKADLIVSYYTIQFIPPRIRQDLINIIFKTLNWGGCFLLFEKVRGPDARFQDMCTGIYNDYKLKQGYTADEIIAKSRSLKGVFEPFSTQGNLDLLERAGFKDVMTVMKYIPFEGFMAIK